MMNIINVYSIFIYCMYVYMYVCTLVMHTIYYMNAFLNQSSFKKKLNNIVVI